MSQIDVEPIRFIKIGKELEVRFFGVDDDEYKWYKGVVSDIVSFGNDEHGGFIECDIDYEDGEKEKRTRLYNKDYNSESVQYVDTWRFVGTISLLITYLMKNTEEVKSLKKDFSEKDEEVRSLVQDLFESFYKTDGSDGSDGESSEVDSELSTELSSELELDLELEQNPEPVKKQSKLSILAAFCAGFAFSSLVVPLLQSYQQTGYYTLPYVRCIMSTSE